MIENGELLRVIDLLYVAALDGDWAVPLRAMASLFGSGQAGLIQYDAGSRRTHDGALIGIEPIYRDSYSPMAGLDDLDPAWATMMARSATACPIIHGYAADPELRRTELCQQWLRPQHIHEALEVTTMARPGTIALLSVARRPGAAAFDTEALVAMRELQPHLERALRIRQQLGGASIEHHRMLDVLDHIGQGVLVVDIQARVRHVNRAAAALLSHDDGLTWADGVLACRLAKESHALWRLIGTVAAGGLATGTTLAVRREAGCPLSVLVAPWREDVAWQNGPSGCAIVIVTDPDRSRADGAALVRRYGLTPAEARAALALVDGGGLSAVADRLAVRLSTVRTLIQRAFAKTGTHRQSELVRLIMAPEATGDGEA